jgi:hypothetical protein
MRILRGPFRGAVIVVNPRNSLRKVFGLYEHELNAWLKDVLPRVTHVLDVGANDGYFTFGCAAAFRRTGRIGEVIAFEPQQEHMESLQKSLENQPAGATKITLLQTRVGGKVAAGETTLDAVRLRIGDPGTRAGTLVKIDVEGAELDVLHGAESWLNPTNFFLIEVHQHSFLKRICTLFATRGLRLTRVDQQPLPLLGREMRSEENWWLVSEIGGV